MNKVAYFLLTIFLLTLQQVNAQTPASAPRIPSREVMLQKLNKQHPSWSSNAVIYEVNLRQYHEVSGFKQFEKELPRLKKLGVNLLWFMPVHPIGVKERKGLLGSYYAVADYEKVNPEFGTVEEFKHMVKAIHEAGMYVIIDWVANHTAADSRWSREHPEYFSKDSTGKFIPPVADWSDVIDLDYQNREMRSAMINAMKFWLTETGIDGFRCDVAEMVPHDFWVACTTELKKIQPNLFMLAEGEQAELHVAFDMTYTWSLFGDMRKIAKGEKDVSAISEYLVQQQKKYNPNALRMYFTTNHDENSWNGTEYEMFGDGHKAFFILGATLNGMPLLYSGQEAGLNKRLKFFDKDPIDWSQGGMEIFYSRILQLKRTNPSLEAGSTGGSIAFTPNSQPKQVLSYFRRKGNEEILVVLNLSSKPANVILQAFKPVAGYKELYTGQELGPSSSADMTLKPWDYKVFVKQK